MANRTHTRLFGLCLVALCLALAPMQTAAQSQGGTGTIVGTVYDSSNAVVPGAKVSATAKGTGFTREAEANDAGQYRIILLPPGNYTVTVAHTGFKTYKGEIEITVGSTPTLDIRLTVGAASETIEVTASVVVETTTSTADALINERSIDGLPINGRRFHDFVELTPTVQIEPSRGGISFSGQRGINANITIDGADYNQPFFGGIRGGERSNSAFSIPQEAIQEFQVVSSGFSAEFGRSTGGLVNAVTKSGSNEWHGSAFWYGRFAELVSRDAFRQEALDNQHQFGGSIGGPIVKDRTFFFFSIEDQQVNNPRRVVFQTLNAITRDATNGEAFDFYRNEEGPFSQTNDAITYLGRVDHNFSGSHRLNARYHYSKNEALNAVATGNQIFPETNNALSNNGTEGNNSHNITGQYTGIFGPSIVNEFRGTWSREERPRTSNSSQAGIGATIGNTGARSFLPTTQDDYRIQLTNNLNWSSGNHSVKVGGDFNYLHIFQFFQFNQFGIFSISGSNVNTVLQLMSLDPGNPNDRRLDSSAVTYRVNIGNGLLSANMHELAFYVHDTWRIHPRFTINAGFRWEGYFNPQPDVSNTALYNAVANFPFPLGAHDPANIPDNTDQFMPRLGFAWDPFGNSKTVIRANGGIYYARTPMLLLAGPLNNFRAPAGDLSLQLPFALPTGYVCTPLAAGDNCATVYWQMRRAGIDLNTLSLGSLPTLTQTDLANIATGLGLTVDPNRGLAPTAISNDFESPRSWNWSAGFDHELARGWSVGAEFSYLNTVHLQLNRDYNLPVPQVFTNTTAAAIGTVQPGQPFDASLRPCFGLRTGITNVCPPPAALGLSITRPLSTLNAVQFRESIGRSLYRALILRSVYRRSKFQVQTYYTLSKNLSNDDNERDSGGQSAVNAYNLQDEYGFSRLDARHSFQANVIYELPWDFQVSSLAKLRSGRPLDPQTGADTNGDFASPGFDRPFMAPGVPFARNSFRNRPVKTVDLRVAKRFRFTERSHIDVTADFFNIFNIDNVLFGTNAQNYGVGITTTGAMAAVDTRFRRLFNPASCFPANPNGNDKCYDRTINNTPGNPFQMQIGVRFQF